MILKHIKKLRVNSYNFIVKWDKETVGASFSYNPEELIIGLKKNANQSLVFMYLCHELMEIVALEVNVRLKRPDCATDYIFVYDHRQHETMMNMFAGLLSQFIK